MTAIIWIVSAITLIISYKLFNIAAGTISIRYFNTVTYVFYYCIIISAFVGSILCAFDFGRDHWILCHASHGAKVVSWLAVCYSMITIPIGMIAVNNFFSVHPKKEFYTYINKPIILSLSDYRLRVILLCLILFSICTFLYIKACSGSWPLYTAIIEKDFLAAQEGRIDVRRNFYGIIYVKNICGLMFVPLFSFFAYIVAQRKKSLFYRFCFVILLLCTLLILSYDTQKAPVIFYAIGYLVIYVLTKGAISLKYIIIFVFGAIFLMGLMYASFNANSNRALDVMLDPRSAMWGRMFISGYAGVPLSFEWFPNVITQSTWQIGIPEFILRIFDMPTTESARLMMLKIEPEGNLISSYFIAEAWANYGIIGVIIAPFIVGFNIQIVQIFLLRSPKNPLIIAFYAFMTTRWVISSGFVNYLFFKVIIIGFVVYYLSKLFIYRLTIR